MIRLRWTALHLASQILELGMFSKTSSQANESNDTLLDLYNKHGSLPTCNQPCLGFVLDILNAFE